MKHKLKVISSKIRKSVRKLMPQPCRAFRSRARLELGRKVPGRACRKVVKPTFRRI